METHWNLNTAVPGFYNPIDGKNQTNAGIMKVYSDNDCEPSNDATYGYHTEEGISVVPVPDANYHTELEILLDNPQLHDEAYSN